MGRVTVAEYIVIWLWSCWLYLSEMTVMTSMVPAPASTERTLATSVFQMTAAIFLCVSPSARLYLRDS